MKRIFTVLAASALFLTGCGSKSEGADVISEHITYVPSDAVMKSNMDKLGYQASSIGDIDKNGYTLFSASNGKENEEFEGVIVMRAKDSEELENQKQQNRGVEADRVKIYALVNDPDYGNILITGTEKGIHDAGIKHD